MNDAPIEYRFYGELAEWWPLISPPDEYAEEAEFVRTLLRSAAIPVREVLELGSGGGHIAVHLKSSFSMTLVDLSDDMLEMSRRLNPESEHQRGDLRAVRLGRTLDAILIHDAVDYVTNEADLRRAIESAFVHCRPGGIAVFVPDAILESFEESTDHGGVDDADGRGARYLEWTWDPDPADSWVLTEYAFLLRSTGGSMKVVYETHRTGLFSRDLWLRLLHDAGFKPEAVTEQTTEDRSPRELFVGRRADPKHHTADGGNISFGGDDG